MVKMKHTILSESIFYMKLIKQGSRTVKIMFNVQVNKI